MPIPPYVMRLVASAADVDELGHVSNLVYVRWIQEVAKAHSASVGLDFLGYQRVGGIFVVRRHEIDYLAPVLGGDEIEVVTTIAGWKGATSERHTRIVRVRDGKDAARAVTQWAFVSIPEGRPRRIAPEVVEAFVASGKR